MLYTHNLLKGEKVHLAALSRDDLPTYQTWFANPELLTYFQDQVVNSGFEEEADIFSYTVMAVPITQVNL